MSGVGINFSDLSFLKHAKPCRPRICLSGLKNDIGLAPQDRASVVVGYPMTKRGEAKRALRIAVTASATGGLVSAFVLAFQRWKAASVLSS